MEKLDPQRRELLEARMFAKNQSFDSVSYTNYNNGGGSSGSDSSDIQVSIPAFISPTAVPISSPAFISPIAVPISTPAMIEKCKTPPPGKGRKRKIAQQFDDGTLTKPISRPASESGAAIGIAGYFGKKDAITSPNRGLLTSMRGTIPRQPSLPSNNDIAVTSRGTQTEVTINDVSRMESFLVDQVVDVKTARDPAVDDYKREISQLEQQLRAQIAADKKLKEKNARSVELLKEFLIEQAIQHKKEMREKTMRNRLRLGQFNTVRQGATFVEQWSDGHSFGEINKKLGQTQYQKEELDKQRKILQKRKPLSEKTEKKEKRSKFTDDGFLKPASLFSPMGVNEYHEQDEILRLRANAIKKEEQELQQELEKLERERNIHIRELKRINNEDQSRLNHNPILNDRYLLLDMIGKGGFSEVFKGFDLKELRYIACKVHQLNKDWKEDKKANYIKHAVREYTIHRSLNHPRIVQLHDVFEIDSNSFVTVLEYCDGNDLDFMLKQYKNIPEKETRAIIMQVVSALKYLNERKPPVIHYDLKPGNILLGRGVMSWEVKLTDFGLSKILPEDTDTDSMDLTSQGAGTYWYLPPECFVVGKAPPKISSKVDVWSVGIIFYQALYGRKPFGHNLSQASILEQNTILKATNIEFPNKPTVSIEAKNFIRKCLTYKKDERVDVFALSVDAYLKPKRAQAEAKKLEQQFNSTRSNTSYHSDGSSPSQGSN